MGCRDRGVRRAQKDLRLMAMVRLTVYVPLSQLHIGVFVVVQSHVAPSSRNNQAQHS